MAFPHKQLFQSSPDEPHYSTYPNWKEHPVPDESSVQKNGALLYGYIPVISAAVLLAHFGVALDVTLALTIVSVGWNELA